MKFSSCQLYLWESRNLNFYNFKFYKKFLEKLQNFYKILSGKFHNRQKNFQNFVSINNQKMARNYGIKINCDSLRFCSDQKKNSVKRKYIQNENKIEIYIFMHKNAYISRRIRVQTMPI